MAVPYPATWTDDEIATDLACQQAGADMRRRDNGLLSLPDEQVSSVFAEAEAFNRLASRGTPQTDGGSLNLTGVGR